MSAVWVGLGADHQAPRGISGETEAQRGGRAYPSGGHPMLHPVTTFSME